MNTNNFLLLFSTLLLTSFTLPAHAYIGPGAGLGAVAITIAVVLGVLLLLAGFVWFPLKRRMKRKQQQKAQSESAASE